MDEQELVLLLESIVNRHINSQDENVVKALKALIADNHNSDNSYDSIKKAISQPNNHLSAVGAPLLLRRPPPPARSAAVVPPPPPADAPVADAAAAAAAVVDGADAAAAAAAPVVDAAAVPPANDSHHMYPRTGGLIDNKFSTAVFVSSHGFAYLSSEFPGFSFKGKGNQS